MTNRIQRACQGGIFTIAVIGLIAIECGYSLPLAGQLAAALPGMVIGWAVH